VKGLFFGSLGPFSLNMGLKKSEGSFLIDIFSWEHFFGSFSEPILSEKAQCQKSLFTHCLF